MGEELKSHGSRNAGNADVQRVFNPAAQSSGRHDRTTTTATVHHQDVPHSVRGIKPVEFNALARMPVLRHYEEAFLSATGVPLKLVSPAEPDHLIYLGTGKNSFCAMVGDVTATGCDACQQIQAGARRRAAKELAPQQVHCFAGLTEIAVPVVIDGRHVATLMSGQVLRHKPTSRGFDAIVKKLGCGQNKQWGKKARGAYFKTPVIAMGKLEAIVLLLQVFARHLSGETSREAGAHNLEPEAVSRAKEFIQSHAGETITFDEVVRRVGVSRFHFCKIFKKATGITLTEYVAQTRVLKAKVLLADFSLRISDVLFLAGFGSVPQFNNVFRRSTGMSPTEYRAALLAIPGTEPAQVK